MPWYFINTLLILYQHLQTYTMIVDDNDSNADVEDDYYVNRGYKCEDDLTTTLLEIHKCNQLLTGIHKIKSKTTASTTCDEFRHKDKDNDLNKMGGIVSVSEDIKNTECNYDNYDNDYAEYRADKRALIKLKLERERIELEKLKACN